MRTAFFASLSLVVSLVACAAPADTDTDSTAGADEALVLAAPFLQGSWSAGSEGFDLRPDGTFFFDTTAKILNGVALAGGSGPHVTRLLRETGSVKVDAAHKTITFKGNLNTKVFAFEYTHARVLNGVFLPGTDLSSFAAKLTLKLVKLDGEVLDGAPIHFTQVESWCTGAVDCEREESDGTWAPEKPLDVRVANTCDSAKKRCAFTKR